MSFQAALATKVPVGMRGRATALSDNILLPDVGSKTA
jgi:hypothetical protein